jgi:carboxymethylenebutenolidase
MNNHDFNSIQLSDGTAMDLYVAFPEDGDKHPAVLVIQEAFGVNQHIRNVSERLCAAGYAVVSPDLFHRTARLFEGSYDNFAGVAPHFQAVSIEGLTVDLKGSYKWLQEQEFVIPGKIGCIGFCLGGRVAFVANAALPIQAGISYYGGGMEQLTDMAPQIHSDHLFFWGGKDAHIPSEKADVIVNAVKSAGKNYTSITISYADHGFNCDERASYNPLASKEAWAHSLAFFDNRLKA